MIQAILGRKVDISGQIHSGSILGPTRKLGKHRISHLHVTGISMITDLSLCWHLLSE